MAAPTICQGNHTCDTRQPHVCYNDADASWMAERPWEHELEANQ